MKKIFLIIALLSLVGCKPDSEKAITLAKKEIADSIRDPDSAKFRHLRFIQKEETTEGSVNGFVCGQINGKNGFGAYEGYSPFFIEIHMKSKGIFSTAVKYSVFDKMISTNPDDQTSLSIREHCGSDE
ncbi:hypothetical protein [Enterobacter hormaechei]|uniref:hypothetical protein n=1 Tax=Enterobacter hormaechei TaxID=158836 RepID=UPI000F88D4D5|nr:hypothetical protein [Enterobacter hormaechei]RTO99733.1 hypothetical protein EKN57_17475 [Enterobacter hormaechei]